MLLRKCSRRAAVALVVRLDQCQRANRLVHCPKANETLRIRQIAARTRVLDDRGLAACEIADGAVADPPARQLDIGWLCDAELTPRTLDVRAVALGRTTDRPGIPEPPAERRQTGAPFLISALEANRLLERDRCLRRQVGVLEEPDQLVVAQLLAAEADHAAPPMSDRRVGCAGLRRSRRPLGQEHRRRRVVPPEAAVGELGRRCADRFSDGGIGVGRHYIYITLSETVGTPAAEF